MSATYSIYRLYIARITKGGQNPIKYNPIENNLLKDKWLEQNTIQCSQTSQEKLHDYYFLKDSKLYI